MMKAINSTLFLAFFSAVLLFSCTSKSQQNQDKKEYNSAYVCPMHCEGSGSEEPGTCPVCGMDYIQNTEKQKQSFNPNNHANTAVVYLSNFKK